MKHRYFHFLRSSLVLFLCALLILATNIFTPVSTHAFGSLSENGTAAFMGIGTVPQKILHVSGSGAGSVPLFQRGSDSAGFIIERTSTNRWVLGVNESPSLGNGFVLSTIPTGTQSVPRLLVTPQGRVGIGTTSPSTLSKLHVYSDNVTTDALAIYGETDTGGTYGVKGKHLHTNSFGYLGGSNSGVYGYSNAGNAVEGLSGSGYAGYFDGKVRITDDLKVGASPGVGIGRKFLTGSGSVIEIDGGLRTLGWDATNNRFTINNYSDTDWCDYWWRTQKGGTVAGGSGYVDPSDQAYISNIDTDCMGIEIHFGQADGTAGWCSIWMQHLADKIVAHYISY